MFYFHFVRFHVIVLLCFSLEAAARGQLGLAHGQPTAMRLLAFVAVVWFDGCISAIAAGANDMEEDLSSSSLGKLYAKIPFNLFRVMVGSVGVLNTVFLVIAALS